VVVLPAPLGPRKPRISPGKSSKDKPSTARTSPNSLTRFSTRIILTSLLPQAYGNLAARKESVRDLQCPREREQQAQVNSVVHKTEIQGFGRAFQNDTHRRGIGLNKRCVHPLPQI